MPVASCAMQRRPATEKLLRAHAQPAVKSQDTHGVKQQYSDVKYFANPAGEHLSMERTDERTDTVLLVRV